MSNIGHREFASSLWVLCGYFTYSRFGEVLLFLYLKNPVIARLSIYEIDSIDYITGIGASIKEKQGLSSEVGFWGLIKKTLMIMAVFLAHRADIALNLDVLMYGALYAFIANEVVSIVENYGRLGLPLPNAFKNLITILKGKEDKTGGSQ